MEGPTPVSALIHAATMVTAGVFLIIRCSIIFEYTPNLLNFMTIVGAFTAFLAASSAAFQNDIKKIIAYSTCSQLGYMVMACSVSQYSVAVFHLINHAFFKALLFLGAGIIIHALSGEQDMRRMGGLLKILPLTYITMLIASFALTGFPFLAGFYSKEIILGSLFCANTFISTFAYWIGLISAMLTSFYSAKILYLVFIATPKGFRISYLYAHTTPFIALFPLIVLSFFSITSGFLLKDAFIGIGTQFFDGIVFSVSNSHKIGDIEQMPSWLKILTIFIGLFGFIWFTFKHFFFNFNTQKVRPILLFFSNKWYFDLIYNELIVNSVYSWSYFVGYKLVDKGIIELLGPSISTKLSLIFSNVISNSQNGWVSSYIRVMLLSFIFTNFYFY